MLRPTAYLTVKLSSENATADMASALKRSFSYLAPTTIAKANADAGEADENSLRLDVRLPAHPYLNAGDPEADRIWSEVVLPWLETKLATLFGTVYEFNNESRRSFVAKLDYATFTLILEGRELRFRLEPDSSLRPCAHLLGAIRIWLAGNEAAALDVESVEIPSQAECAHAGTEAANAKLSDGTSLHIPLG